MVRMRGGAPVTHGGRQQRRGPEPQLPRVVRHGDETRRRGEDRRRGRPAARPDGQVARAVGAVLEFEVPEVEHVPAIQFLEAPGQPDRAADEAVERAVAEHGHEDRHALFIPAEREGARGGRLAGGGGLVAQGGEGGRAQVGAGGGGGDGRRVRPAVGIDPDDAFEVGHVREHPFDETGKLVAVVAAGVGEFKAADAAQGVDARGHEPLELQGNVVRLAGGFGFEELALEAAALQIQIDRNRQHGQRRHRHAQQQGKTLPGGADGQPWDHARRNLNAGRVKSDRDLCLPSETRTRAVAPDTLSVVGRVARLCLP